MRVAVIYRPKSAAPAEAIPMMMEALGEWVETCSKQVTTLEFFAAGGGFVVADFDESSDLHQLVVTNPFTPYMDVEILPVVEPATAMATWGEIAAAYADAGCAAGLMQAVAFALPLLVGQTDRDRSALASCWRGERREAHQDARRRAGITREAVWIQPQPRSDVAVIYLEADDVAAAFAVLGTSAEPFDLWFRELVRRVHGIDLSDGLDPPELVLDFDIDRI